MKKKLHRAYVKRETARIKALNAILIARRKNPSLRPTTCQCGCGVIGRLYADFDDPVHPFDGLRFLASLCKGKATRARRAAQKRTQARCVANKDENHALEYTPNATSESTTTLLEALELPKNEFKTIAAENKRSVAVEFGVPDVRFTASKEEYLSRFMRMRVPAQMRPLRSELQLALAITGDRVAYDPDWEPDCE